MGEGFFGGLVDAPDAHEHRLEQQPFGIKRYFKMARHSLPPKAAGLPEPPRHMRGRAHAMVPALSLAMSGVTLF